MRKFRKISLFFLVILISLISCKKEVIDDFTLVSMESGNVDLFGSTSAVDVPVDQPIVAVFSTDIDAATVSSGLSILQGTTDVAFTTSVSGKTLTITITDGLVTGTKYNLTFSAELLSAQGKAFTAKTIQFTTVGVGIDTPPQADKQVLYLQFNNSVVDMVGDHTNPYNNAGYTEDRFGNANGAALFAGAATAGTGEIIEIAGDDLINPSMTLNLWFKINSADYAGGGLSMFGLATERGYFMELGGGLGWCKLATSHKIDPDPNNHYYGTAWTDPNGDGTVGGQTLYDYLGDLSVILGDKWTMLTMTFDATTSIKTIYLDGVKIMQVDLNLDATEWNLADMEIASKADGTGDPITGIDPVLTLGYFCSRANTATGWSDYSTATNTFKGMMDDFRIFNVALSESEVTTLFNSEN
jgi:hypothetical protein